MGFSISTDALDFALAHILAKGDTDILPPAFEYKAIHHDWLRIRKILKKENLHKRGVRPARRFLSPKRGLGFRIATQLDPLDCILITALVYEIGEDLESHRVPISSQTVHSYRFAPTPQGQLYDPRWGFDTFRSRSLELAQSRGGYVLMTDIADFFQRVYLHRLENTLSVATQSDTHSKAIIKMIKGWHQNVSYGLPVGPSIFRLLSEVTIHDVDEALLSQGYQFCRFSDDYRIFVSDEHSARTACAFLANTLLRIHGLTIQESKTEIVTADEFYYRFEKTERDAERAALNEQFDDLTAQLQEQEIERFLRDDMFTENWVLWMGLDSYRSIDYDHLSEGQKQAVDSLNLWELLRTQLESESSLDVPLTRFVLRRITQLGLQDNQALLLSDLSRLYPVFPQLVEALAVQHPASQAERHRLGSQLLTLFDDPVVGHLKYHRAWILSVFADPSWDQTNSLIGLYQQYPDQLTRPALIGALGAAGVPHWFSTKKQDVTTLPPWERRAFLAGARCLPNDEATHWYRSIMTQLDVLDRSVVNWALANL